MAPRMNKEQLYRELRRRIITMDLAPGTDLDEAELSKAYGMSRTPVRETLIRLQSDGLVVARRNRGASVAPLDMATLQSWFEAGQMLHRAILRLACRRRTTEDLEQIKAAMEEFESAMKAEETLDMVYANERFHDRIGRAARNPYLYASYQRVLADHERISGLCYGYEIRNQAKADKDLTVQQHRELYYALVAQDSEAAERVIGEHLSLCWEGLRKVMQGSAAVLADVTLDEA